ncbi:MAG: hypothetical protein COY66_05125, partial [Candidatus Kerfeldbacteria bacterium CG_4_10_14_0_8_um_filter_42_10]
MNNYLPKPVWYQTARKQKFLKVINIAIMVTFLFNMTAFQSIFLALPLQADAIANPNPEKKCPPGDVKYEIGNGYEYTDSSADIWGDSDIINWAAKPGYKITSVCVKIGGPGDGSLKNPDPKAGTAGPYDHDISHIVVKTDKCKGRCEPDLQISKSDSPDPVMAGQDITYTIEWSNEGNGIAWMTNIVDELPDEVTFVDAYPGGIYHPADHKVTWWLGPVLPDASGTKTLVVNVEPETPAGIILNEVKIDSLFTDPVSDEEETTVTEPFCDLTISKGVRIFSDDEKTNNEFITDNSKLLAEPGQTLEYRIRYENIGNADCTGSGVIVGDQLNDYLTFVERSREIRIFDRNGHPVNDYEEIAGYDGKDQIKLYNVQTVSPGEYGIITFDATIADPMPCGNTDVNNKAGIWSVETDKIWSEQVTTDVYQGCGSLRVEKEVVGGEADPDEFGFRISGWTGAYTYPNSGENYVVFEDLIPGTYSVEEEIPLPANYHQTNNDCTGVKVSAEPNAAAIAPASCTITNTYEEPGPATIIAQKVVCQNEADLPDWGVIDSVKPVGTPGVITASTATEWVNSHPGCSLVPWDFQWVYNNENYNPGDNFGAAGLPWHTFSGSTQISDFGPDNKIWVREVWNNEYIPFASVLDPSEPQVSAEIYCGTDILNYDNWEWIDNLEHGQTYYCVGFNVPEFVPGTISGYKYDTQENPLNDWEICLNQPTDNLVSAERVTVLRDDNCVLTGSGEWPDGYYEFTNLAAGTYLLSETFQDSWIQMSAPDPVTVESGTVSENNNFVNTPENPGLSLTKEITASDLTVGGSITYQLNYANTGNVELTGVQIVDDYPEQYVTVTDAGGAVDDGSTLTWTIGNLAVGASNTLTYTVQIKNSTPADTEIVNIATITSEQTEPATAQALAQMIEEPTPPEEPEVTLPTIELNKSVSSGSVEANETLTYLVEWRVNDADATNVTITDPIPLNTTFVSASNEG